MTDSLAFLVDGDDPAMVAASERARAELRYFWRELHWEHRRIVPALDMSAFKAAFTERVEPGFLGRLFGREAADVTEVMWISDVVFDGRTLRGTLMNRPNDLRGVSEGDAVELPVERVVDWIYSLQGTVYGAFTVQAMRARMASDEREAHDAAWGLDFGDPLNVKVCPDYGGPDAEHPMSENCTQAYATQLAEGGAALLGPDDGGWTPLHHEALGGSLGPCRALLEAGADPHARTPDGRTARDLAEGIGWTRVAALLAEAE